MKKLFVLLSVVCACTCLSAQTVKESVIPFGKEQISGYLLDVQNVSVEVTEAALRDKFENQYGLKPAKESGFRAYLNQAFAPFGTANYDIYFTVGEYGKKKNKTTQVSFVVCTGNHNAITSSNNPEASLEIKNFLQNFVNYIQVYTNNKEIEALEAQLAKLQKERKDLDGNVDKINKQIKKLNQELEETNNKISDKDNEIKKVEADLKKAKNQ